MRTFGRTYPRDSSGKIIPGSKGTWVVVQTDANGHNDLVYLTTLYQCLQGNLNESPFYSNYGLPAHESIIQQIFPDFDMMKTQQQFSPYFASLVIAKLATPSPQYQVNVVTNSGVKLSNVIAV